MADEHAELAPGPRPDDPREGRFQGKIPTIARGLAGAVIGGVLGYIAFGWILRQGFYAMVLPGGLIGLGCGVLSRGKSVFLGAVCGVGSVGLCLFLEWRFFPFVKDPSFAYFLSHLHLLRPMTWILIGVGAVIAFWFGTGRERRT